MLASDRKNATLVFKLRCARKNVDEATQYKRQATESRLRHHYPATGHILGDEVGLKFGH
jgi:hypothetical protein